MMTNPYFLLNHSILQLEENKEVRRILEFAEQVVKRFYADLRRAAINQETHSLPFLLLSHDKVSFGDPAKITEGHFASTVTGKAGKFISLPEPLTAEEALRVFMFDEPELRVTFVMLLVHLRQIHDDGSSKYAERLLERSFLRLKNQLAYHLSAYAATDAVPPPGRSQPGEQQWTSLPGTNRQTSPSSVTGYGMTMRREWPSFRLPRPRRRLISAPQPRRLPRLVRPPRLSGARPCRAALASKWAEETARGRYCEPEP